MNASELLNYKNWVVAGSVLNETKFAHKILKALEKAEYNVVGMNPRDKTEQLAKSLKEIGKEIDVIDLCINPKSGIEIVKEAKELGIDKVLIQPGAESQEIIDYCKENEITAIEGCALVELANAK